MMACDNSAKFLDLDFSKHSPRILQEWNHLAESFENSMQCKQKVYFTARVYPTPPQLFGSYVLLTSIEKINCVSEDKEEGVQNALKIEGGSLFSAKREVKCSMGRGGEDDDGILTYIENQAKKLKSDHVWYKSVGEMKQVLKSTEK